MEKLITKYTHSGNTTIQPLSLDVSTGIFTTAAPHNLGTNSYPCFFYTTNDYVRPFPYEIYNSDHQNNTTNTWRIKGLTDTTFILMYNNANVTSYLSAYNTSLDCSKMLFEYNAAGGTTQITLNNLGGLTNYRIVCTGRKVAGNIKLNVSGNIVVTPANGYFGTDITTTTSWKPNNRIIYEILVKNNCFYTVLDTIYPDKSKYQFGEAWISSRAIHNMMFCSEKTPLSTFTFTETYTPMIQNGFTVEVYEIIDDVDIISNKLVSAGSNIYTLDLSQFTNFNIETEDTVSKTIEFSNVPNVVTVCVTLKYTNAASMTYPLGTTWKDSMPPSLTAGKTYILMFTTLNGGTSWQGSWVGAW